mmetsp:Transcript_33377/g.6043  ORF Transcript_33377/g.6043 Transcript_33377/m.6043 type:complete len:94 (-) Transcript_33377:699-980(-)
MDTVTHLALIKNANSMERIVLELTAPISVLIILQMELAITNAIQKYALMMVQIAIRRNHALQHVRNYKTMDNVMNSVTFNFVTMMEVIAHNQN